MSAGLDRGLLLGDGLFETVLARSGVLDDWDAHLERLEAGCGVLGLPPPERAACETAAQAALREAGLERERAAVRLTWSAGEGGRGLERPEPPRPRLWASAAPAPEVLAPATLAFAAVRRNSTSPASRLKTLSYLDNVLARRQARALGCDEAVMLNEREELACAAAGNLFWVSGGRLFTPAAECGVLDGIVRRRVLRAAACMDVEVAEARWPREALENAEAVFLTNSLMRLRPVRSLGGRSFEPCQLVQALADAVR